MYNEQPVFYFYEDKVIFSALKISHSCHMLVSYICMYDFDKNHPSELNYPKFGGKRCTDFDFFFAHFVYIIILNNLEVQKSADLCQKRV